MSDTTQPLMINDDSKIDNNIMISTNLYTAIVPTYNSSITNQPIEPGEIITTGYTKTPSNGGYIQLPYISPSGSVKPNATYVNGTTVKNYKTSNIYIFKASHVIENITYDAEMVVELVPTTNPGEKLYLCFLLKSYRDIKQPINDIDKIIINAKKSSNYKTNNFNLQPFIKNNQKKIIYNNNIDTVIIFTEPIPIKEYDFSNYFKITPDIFSITPNDYKLIRITTQEGFKEGAQGQTSIMTCSPINTGEKEENDNALVLMATNKGANIMTNSIISSIIVVFITIFLGLLIIPQIYFILINITNLINNNEKIVYSIMILIMFIILGMVLMSDGYKFNRNDECMAGAAILAITVFSGIGIFIRKQDRNSIGLNFEGISKDVILNGLYTMLIKIGKSWMYIIPGFLLILVILFTVVFAVIEKKNNKNKNNKNKNLSQIILGIGISYSLIMCIIIGCFITST